MSSKNLVSVLSKEEGAAPSSKSRGYIAAVRVLSSLRKRDVGVFLLLLFLSNLCSAQTNFSILQLPGNAFQQALGGKQTTAWQSNASAFGQNPALLDTTHHKIVGLSYSPLYSQANFITTSYSWKTANNATWGVQASGITWGSFDGRDATGNATEKFSAGDVVLALGHARQQGNFRLGMSTKLASSFIENYQTMAFIIDAGGIFKHPEKDFTAGFSVHNIGFSLYNYAIEPLRLPFDIRAGVTFKPTYMPARISISADKLYKLKTLDAAASLVQQLTSHLSVGSQFIVHPNVQLLAGFDFRKNNELKIENLNRMGGFSYGINYATSKMGICLSRQTTMPAIGLWMMDFYWRLH